MNESYGLNNLQWLSYILTSNFCWEHNRSLTIYYSDATCKCEEDDVSWKNFCQSFVTVGVKRLTIFLFRWAIYIYEIRLSCSTLFNDIESQMRVTKTPSAICEVLQLIPDRAYPSENFETVAIDKKFMHGWWESLWSIRAYVRDEIGVALQPLVFSKSLPPWKTLCARRRHKLPLCLNGSCANYLYRKMNCEFCSLGFLKSAL